MKVRLSALFDQQARTISRYDKIVAQINDLEKTIKPLSDKQLTAKTQEFRKQFTEGKTLNDLLPEAYAVIREASRRAIGQRHFDVQLMAGIAFHEGKVAEQKTGEGKTLSATLPLYLNSLSGHGAHLVTVNDYLSQVGAGWMGPIYHLLGVSVGVVIHDQAYIYDPNHQDENRGDERLEHFRPVPRKEAYLADITYGTNNEFGFDYLRDNMAQRATDQVQREKFFAIVDEADSILIDEARTPLIISAPDAEPTDKYVQFAKLVKKLDSATDYEVDEKLKTATLTDLGIKHLEELLKVTNLYEEGFDTLHHMEQALKARTVYLLDKDYVVRDGEIIIVDEHTGRLMFGRRYSDGLHQAIEAKEEVQVQQESRTLATISLQNYFRLYDKIAGMSGTALTEAEEFGQIYKMDVLMIPTNRPVARTDSPDIIYKTVGAKFNAILNEIEEIHKTNRPILIGTRSIEQNQILSETLNRKLIPHQILNAKNHEREAFIIAEAGKPGAITVATNIAGRGVDIVLGGASPERKDFGSAKEYENAVRKQADAHAEVVKTGGLHIIGTERHESRRIDNQLRGRAGRQGDPGSSRFYISLEDELMRIFGGEQISHLMDALKIDENLPIEHPLINRAMTQAQIKVEGFFFDQRRNLVDYDDVMNRQREIIYKRRQNLLLEMEKIPEKEGESHLKKRLFEDFRNHFTDFLNARISEGLNETELDNTVTELSTMIPFDDESVKRIREQLAGQVNVDDMVEMLNKVFADIYKLREDSLGSPLMREIERFVFLSTIDEQWMTHLDDMTHLRDGIWLRGSKDQALAEYKKEAFRLFKNLVNRVELEALRKVFRIQVQPVVQNLVPQNAQEVGPAKTSIEGSSIGSPAVVTQVTTAQPEKTVSRKPIPKKGKLKKKGSYLRKK